MKPIEMKICCGMNCTMHGSQEILNLIENTPSIKDNSKIEYVQCFNLCDDAKNSPVVEINGKIFTKISSESFLDLVNSLIGN